MSDNTNSTGDDSTDNSSTDSNTNNSTEPETSYRVAREALWNIGVDEADQGTINDAHDLVDHCLKDDNVTIDGYQDKTETDSDLARTVAVDVLRYIHQDAPDVTNADKQLAGKAARVIEDHEGSQTSQTAEERVAAAQEAAAGSDVETITGDLVDALETIYAGGENLQAFGIATEMARRHLDATPQDIAERFRYVGTANPMDVVYHQEQASEMNERELGSYLVAALVNESIRHEKAPALGIALEVARRWADFGTDVEKMYRWASSHQGDQEVGVVGNETEAIANAMTRINPIDIVDDPDEGEAKCPSCLYRTTTTYTASNDDMGICSHCLVELHHNESLVLSKEAISRLVHDEELTTAEQKVAFVDSLIEKVEA